MGAPSPGGMERSLVRTGGGQTEEQYFKGEGRHLGSCHQWLPVLREQPGTAQPTPCPGVGDYAGLGGKA